MTWKTQKEYIVDEWMKIIPLDSSSSLTVFMPAEAWEAAPAGQIYPEVQHCGAVEDGYTDGLTMQLVSFSDIDKVFPLPATRLSPIEEVSHLTSSPISLAERTQLATELRVAQGAAPTAEVSDHVLLRLRMLREAEALKGKDQEASPSSGQSSRRRTSRPTKPTFRSRTTTRRMARLSGTMTPTT